MKVESPKQIRSQTCCSVAIDVQEDAHRRLSEKEQPWIWVLRKNEKQPEPWCLDCTLNLAILILEE